MRPQSTSSTVPSLPASPDPHPFSFPGALYPRYLEWSHFAATLHTPRRTCVGCPAVLSALRVYSWHTDPYSTTSASYVLRPLETWGSARMWTPASVQVIYHAASAYPQHPLLRVLAVSWGLHCQVAVYAAPSHLAPSLWVPSLCAPSQVFSSSFGYGRHPAFWNKGAISALKWATTFPVYQGEYVEKAPPRPWAVSAPAANSLPALLCRTLQARTTRLRLFG